MSSRTDNLVKLAKVKRGVTLCSSSSGDQHFLVNVKGSAEKIPLEKACQLYIAAKKKGDLLWNRSPKTNSPDPIQRPATHPESSKAWRDELREKLGYDADPK